ncbi:MAG: DNA adenine methylase [Gammaproteobacteria bacterium]|nr:DNA adenine methylase [Gammaproteobacteria bacterium]
MAVTTKQKLPNTTTSNAIKFPRTQYLGSKEKLVQWIFENSPKGIETFFDAFSGTSVLGYYFKTKGARIISNDFLKFNYHIAKALIENNTVILTDSDLALLFEKNNNAGTLIEEVFTDVFFEREQANFLDNFRANVSLLDNTYKQSLALTIMNRALTRKILLGHFAHTSAIRYSKDAARVKRNPSIAKPIKTLFLDLLADYNNAVFDNKKNHAVFCEDTTTLVKTLENVDVAYFDPPYCGCHPDYQAFYHFLETFVEYWQDKQFRHGTKAYFPKKDSGFTQKAEIKPSFEKLFENSQHIPHWLISYNSKSYPNKDVMIEMIEKHKKVKTFEYEYQNHYGGKGSRKGTKEYLFYCYD